MRNSLPSHQAGTALAVVRVCIGLLGLLSPRRAQQASLLPATTDASTPVWTRFWATRALALGVGYLTADPPTRRHLIRVGLIVDATDTGFLALTAAARQRLPRRALLWLATTPACPPPRTSSRSARAGRPHRRLTTRPVPPDHAHRCRRVLPPRPAVARTAECRTVLLMDTTRHHPPHHRPRRGLRRQRLAPHPSSP